MRLISEGFSDRKRDHNPTYSAPAPRPSRRIPTNRIHRRRSTRRSRIPRRNPNSCTRLSQLTSRRVVDVLAGQNSVQCGQHRLQRLAVHERSALPRVVHCAAIPGRHPLVPGRETPVRGTPQDLRADNPCVNVAHALQEAPSATGLTDPELDVVQRDPRHVVDPLAGDLDADRVRVPRPKAGEVQVSPCGRHSSPREYLGITPPVDGSGGLPNATVPAGGGTETPSVPLPGRPGK